MESPENTRALAALLHRDVELAEADYGDEADLLRRLVDHLDYLVDQRMEWLLSLMYRMDIDERRVRAALRPDAAEPANVGLARLILERQKQRLHTKKAYPPEDLGDEWGW